MSRTKKSSTNAPKSRRAAERCRPQVHPLEDRCVPDAGFRSTDGTGNNLAHNEWGSAGVPLLRTAPAAYADGADDLVVGSPARPSPRFVSNKVVARQFAQVDHAGAGRPAVGVAAAVADDNQAIGADVGGGATRVAGQGAQPDHAGGGRPAEGFTRVEVGVA